MRRMNIIINPFVALGAAFALAGCLTETKLEERTVFVGGPDSALLAAEGQTLNLRFVGRFGGDTLKTGRKYRTSGGDSVRFEMARFYVSEIALVDSNGASHHLMGVHLVNLLDSAAQARGYAVVTLKALPGTYRGVRFSVGVPFDQNHRDAATQSAPLGTETGMFWNWNSGYIFHRIEGKVDSAGVEKSFAYHVGGDNSKVQVNLFSLRGATSTFTVSGGHHKVAAGGGLAKAAHEVATNLPIQVAYNALFSTGLVPGEALRPSLNVNERQFHGMDALAGRVFLNTQSMFTLGAADTAVAPH